MVKLSKQQGNTIIFTPSAGQKADLVYDEISSELIPFIFLSEGCAVKLWFFNSAPHICYIPCFLMIIANKPVV